MSETFYDLLGVPETATTSEIETAYREAIKQVHPDVSDDVDAGERTKRLNRAKRVLTDDEERRRYDRVGHEAYTSDSVRSSTSSASGADESGETGSTGRESDDTAASSGGWRDRRQRERRQSRRGRRDPGRGPNAGSGSGFSTRGGRGGSSGERSGASGGSKGGGGGRGAGTGGGRSGQGTSGSGPDTDGPWATGTDRTGPSRASEGPSWQSSRAGASTAEGAAAGSPSGRRQAATGQTDGPNVDWSWNSWERTRSWAVRQGGDGPRSFHPSHLFPAEQSVVLLASSVLLYPFFVASILFPPFPIVARAAVGMCTLLMFTYLLSVPQVAVVVYGVWSVVFTAAVVILPGLTFLSFTGVVGLSATWAPLLLSLLTFSILRR